MFVIGGLTNLVLAALVTSSSEIDRRYQRYLAATQELDGYVQAMLVFGSTKLGLNDLPRYTLHPTPARFQIAYSPAVSDTTVVGGEHQ